jgi:pyruvate ferredoxin oxidoreductase beta subunit
MTTPSGKASEGVVGQKKNMIAFAVSQGLEYVASSSIAYPKDIEEKIKESMKYKGPKYIQILVPCVPGWNYESRDTITIARLAATTGFYPILEIVKGKITKALRVSGNRPKIDEYLKMQGRFKHLFADEKGRAIIKKLQLICDQNIETYGLCSTCEEHDILTHYRLENI